MSSSKALRLLGTVGSRGEAGTLLRAAGDAVLVERGRPRLLVLRCPCGCGEDFPINLDPRAGPAWRLYRAPAQRYGLRAGPGFLDASTSLFPSVWRESGCRSHYVIWRDRILLFSGGDEELDQTPDHGKALEEAAYAELRTNELRPFAQIAEALKQIPWDVLVACRSLVRSDRAIEGTSQQRGCFRRR